MINICVPCYLRQGECTHLYEGSTAKREPSEEISPAIRARFRVHGLSVWVGEAIYTRTTSMSSYRYFCLVFFL